MTREYLGRFSGLELILAIVSVSLTAGALVWLLVGEPGQRHWQWLMFVALILTVLGQQLRRRRLEREYGGGDTPRR